MFWRSSARIGDDPMTPTLISRQDAELKIASLTAEPCGVEVVEERAFVNENSTSESKCLSLGSISLKQAFQPGGEPADAEHQRALLGRDGTFEWSLPCASEVKKALEGLLGDDDKGGDVSKALNSIAAIYVRTGMVNPILDAEAVESMPFRRSATVVSDTSGVLQGGLDFIVRHIPKARVKIPAIVQMEIRNIADRFLTTRRGSRDTKQKKERAAKQLVEHLMSQGAERTLLRLELKDDVEIERTFLLGDPLRSAFAPDNTIKGLQLSVPLRTYVDRLILEAARHHQAQSEPGHTVYLLTSDQGQARMALAEGIRPLYFRSIRPEEVLGRCLTGRPLDPFTGEPRPVSLASIVWELATAFGHARLTSRDGTFAVSAMGKDLPWSPYHSIDDLLWYEFEKKEAAFRALADQSNSEDVAAPVVGTNPERGVSSTPPPSYQRMNVNHLLRLICALDDRQTLEQVEVERLLGLSSVRTSYYRRFLTLADCIRLDGAHWTATDRLRELSIAARVEDPRSMQKILTHAPSFLALVQRAKGLNNGEPLDLSDVPKGSRRTYLVLGELTLLCASVGRSTVYPTLNHPDPADFSELALARFSELAGSETIVATGRWLESLIQHDGVHPEVARRSLEQATEAGLIRRSTEGSTVQTQYDDHVVHVLRIEDGMPVAKPIRLYRGDYLIPGKASVSLRLEGSES